MSDPAPITVPSTPNPPTEVLVYTVIRAGLTIGGTFGLTIGSTVTDSQWQTIAGATATLIGVGWSIWQKYRAAKLDHAGSVASANAGRPVKAVALP